MKYVKHILLISILVFLFGSVSLASSGHTDGEIGERIKEIVAEDQEVNNDYLVNYYDYLGTALNDNDNYLRYSLISYKTSNGRCVAVVGVISDLTSTSFTLASTGSFVSFRGSDWVTNTMNSGTYSGMINVVDRGLMHSWFNVVDFDNPIYDGTIYSPNFNIQNKLHAGTENIDLQYVSIGDDNIYNHDITFYKCIKMYLYSSKDVLVDYGKFTINSYYKSDPIMIYDYSDLCQSVGIQGFLDLNDYKSDAQDFLQYVKDYVNLNYVSGMSAGTQLSRTTEFLNNLEKGFPHFVNGVEIWAQNFYIYEDKVYVSNWTKWNSVRYSNYENIVPVADDQPAKGIKNTETPYNNISQNANTEDTYNPVGEQTGSDNSINVTINNSTPNYPDYPTAVSYNHDNILMKFIETANYIPNMFSGFGAFLGDAFTFIDPGIWTIIGYGFFCSIAIMIVKVL